MQVHRAKRWLVTPRLYRLARFAYRHLLHRAGLRDLQDQMALYKALIRPGDLCFDIGANRGLKSEAMLRLGARVVAVEPQQDCISEMRKRLGHYTAFVCIGKAVGSRTGQATLHIADCDVLSSIDSTWFGFDEQWKSKVTVDVTTLDLLIAEYGLPHYCKIDVEGSELDVLSGLSAPIPCISFEFHVDRMRNQATLACLARLQSLGPYIANLSRVEERRFLWEWLSCDEFAAAFAKSIATDEAFDYGEIYVRFQ